MPSRRTLHVYRTTCAGIDVLRVFLIRPLSWIPRTSVQTVTLQRLRAADEKTSCSLAFCGQFLRSSVGYSDSYNFVLITSYCKASNREFLCAVMWPVPITFDLALKNRVHEKQRCGICTMGASQDNVTPKYDATGNNLSRLAPCLTFNLFDELPVDNAWKKTKGTSNF